MLERGPATVSHEPDAQRVNGLGSGHAVDGDEVEGTPGPWREDHGRHPGDGG